MDFYLVPGPGCLASFPEDKKANFSLQIRRVVATINKKGIFLRVTKTAQRTALDEVGLYYNTVLYIKTDVFAIYQVRDI